MNQPTNQPLACVCVCGIMLWDQRTTFFGVFASAIIITGRFGNAGLYRNGSCVFVLSSPFSYISSSTITRRHIGLCMNAAEACIVQFCFSLLPYSAEYS